MFRLTVLVLLTVAGCSATHHNSRVSARDDVLVEMVSRLVLNDSGGSVAIDHGDVKVWNEGVANIAAVGLPVVPHLLDSMEEPETTFHEFAKCYTAVRLILFAHGVTGHSGWAGLASVSPGGRISPGFIKYDESFRRRVVGALSGQYATALQKWQLAGYPPVKPVTYPPWAD